MKNRFRPTPGTAIAILALVVAVTGVASAGQVAQNSKKKGLTTAKVTGIARSVADQEIAAKAPSLSVANAVTAGSANPIAFAHIPSGGGIDAAKSKNMAGATVIRQSLGLYCFYDLPFAFKGAQTTVDYDDSMNMLDLQFGTTGAAVCNNNDDAYVSAIITGGPGAADAGFFIVFYN
jgi:hypothetical protein